MVYATVAVDSFCHYNSKVDYEWDETKRRTNLRKHGLDFLEADLVFESPTKITIEVSRPTDKETRCADFAKVEGSLLKLVYTLRGRGTTVRCISLRVASRKERRLYDEAKNRPSPKSRA